ncbi:kinase-like protein [Atractiella rhizophila]|nr:kinase-like protein [Atractiella rhizophila]
MAEVIVGDLAASKTAVETITYIIRTIQKVRRFKTKCEEIQKLALLIQSVLDCLKRANKTLQTTEQVQRNLDEVKKFVIDCTQNSSLAQRAWEVIWRQRLSGLMEGLRETALWFLMEAAVQGVTVQDALRDTSKKIHEAVISIGGDVMAARDQLAAFQVLVEEKGKISAKIAGKWEIQFPFEDKHLKVSREPNGMLAGTLEYDDSSTSQVILLEISTTQKVDPFGRGPRHVRIYSEISSANTVIERFHGLAEPEAGKYYMVMEDLRSAKSLGDSLGGTQLGDVKDRLQIAYELSKAIAFLHSVRILVRSLSDDTVKLVERNKEWKPVLTKLEEARLLMEDTLEPQADMRFEAPEYHHTPIHSQETDIWSFGVLLWELMNSKHPFDQREPVIRQSRAEASLPPAAASILEKLQNGETAWTKQGNTPYAGVSALVISCCHPDPSLRPPMASIARSLWLLLRDESVLMSTPSRDQDEIKARVQSYLEKARSAEREAAKKKKSAKKKLTDKTQDDNNVEPQPSSALEKTLLAERDVKVLRQLSHNGDPVAAAILGGAYWRGMVPFEAEDVDVEAIITLPGEEQNVERQALRAIPLLKFAATAGKGDAKLSIKDLATIHARLCDIYGNHYESLKQ